MLFFVYYWDFLVIVVTESKGFRSSNSNTIWAMAKWGYYKSNCPPNDWSSLFPIAASGKFQSPIDLNTSAAVKASHPALTMSYVSAEVTSATNNGHSVTFHLGGENSRLSGGPLTGEYKLLQFHFHWGSDNSKGSEHTLDGKQFAAELHLVHQNTKYKTFEEAKQHQDGLSVIGVFLEVSNGNPAYDGLFKVMKEIPNSGDSAKVSGGIDLMSLLPSNKTYIHYLGSLTTPTLDECVYWISMTNSVTVSEDQISVFRNLFHNEKGAAEEKLVDNWRPVQTLHGRKLEICEQ